jgi:hypothetical protein
VAEQLRADVAAATREVGSAIRGVGSGTMLCAAGATFGLLGALSLLTGVILVAGDQWLPGDWYALAALVVAAVAGIVTWVFVRRGLAILTAHREQRLPEMARAD